MKILCLAGLAPLLAGCALFSGGERSSAVAERALANVAPPTARSASAETFRPAFGIGRPVALVPCRRSVALSDDCRSLNDRHQAGGDMPADDEASALTEASTRPDPQ